MFETIKSRWETSHTGARAAVVIATVVILLAAVWACYWALHTDYQVLFSELDPQDAAQMVAELEKLKTPYKLEDNGSTILVDGRDVHRTRLKLMGKGMNLRGAVGFEVFNDNDFGTSEFAQKVNFQRALQGELARTIMAFDEVKAVRVHLVMPEQGLFRKNNSQAKASVSIVTKGDSRLMPEQIAGIQRLVAASVPEINPASVTIIDQRGVALTANNFEDQALPGASANMALKKDIESYMSRKVGLLLDRALGPGKAIVSVDVSLNYDHIKVVREDVSPANTNGNEAVGVVVRKRRSETGPDNSRPVAANTQSNAGTMAGRQDADGTRSVTTDVEYQVSRQVEQIVSEPGAIHRVSVGVVLHGDVREAQLAQIKEVVAMAAGIDLERGDAVVIHSINPLLEGADQTAAEPGLEDGDGQPEPRKPEAVVLLLVTLAVVLVSMLAYLLVKRRNSEVGDKKALSQEERERLLRQLHDWVSADMPSPVSEGGR